MKDLSTMTTREIAELTGKQHADVVHDLKDTLSDVGIGISGFEQVYLDGVNQGQTEYVLPRRECSLLTSRYSAKQRLAIIDRWIELEALQLALDQQQKLQDAQQQKIEHDEPLVELANATSAKGCITLKEWVNMLKHQGCKIKERRLTEWLMANGYCYKHPLTGDTRGYAHFDHLLMVKIKCINGYSRRLLVVTEAGVRELSAKVLRAHK